MPRNSAMMPVLMYVIATLSIRPAMGQSDCALLTRRRRYEAPAPPFHSTHIAHLTRRRRFHGTTSQLAMTQIVALDGNSAASWGGATDEDVLRKAYASLLGFYISPTFNPEYKLAMTVDMASSQNGTVTVTLTTLMPATPDACTSRNDAATRLHADPGSLYTAMQTVE